MTYRIIDANLFDLHLDKLKILANYAKALGNSHLGKSLEQLSIDMQEDMQEVIER